MFHFEGFPGDEFSTNDHLLPSALENEPYCFREQSTMVQQGRGWKLQVGYFHSPLKQPNCLSCPHFNAGRPDEFLAYLFHKRSNAVSDGIRWKCLIHSFLDRRTSHDLFQVQESMHTEIPQA
jgi:hypothetical protein